MVAFLIHSCFSLGSPAVVVLELVAGLVVLTVGAEFLVRGASSLARAMGIPAIIIGLTIVAFGTSAPELVVSVQSAFKGRPDLSIGNVVGSNIFNILFILGASALIVPLAVARRLIVIDVPIMIGLSLLVYLMGRDGILDRLDGILFFTGLIAYVSWLFVQHRQRPKQADPAAPAESVPGIEEDDSKPVSVPLALVFVVGGLLMMVYGSDLFCEAAAEIARRLGVSELVIGLTIVAMGTSLPEVATSLVAACRGERDIAVGNAVGSNLFNIMCVLGVAATVAPAGIDVSQAALAFDIPVMILVAVVCLPVCYTRREISRWEGGLFFFYACAYVTYIVLTATGSPVRETFEWTMLRVVMPLSAAAVGLSLLRSSPANGESSPPAGSDAPAEPH